MRTESVLCLDSRGFHRMQYYDWGDPQNARVVICVHGLTRNGRDFDFLARALSHDYRVVCPDIAGRGQSDWLTAPGDYSYLQYMADVTTLIARVTEGGARDVSWVGTSMGGILGMLLASLPKNPISALVVNDVGRVIPKAALERLAGYVGKEPRAPTLDALEAHLRVVCAPFGALTDDDWRHLTLHSATRHPDGTWGVRYDPRIAQAFEGVLADVDLSARWDAVSCPTLLLRGADSDILPRDTAHEMTQRGPKARLVEFEGVGHAPMFMNEEQVRVVAEFFAVAVS